MNRLLLSVLTGFVVMAMLVLGIQTMLVCEFCWARVEGLRGMFEVKNGLMSRTERLGPFDKSCCAWCQKTCGVRP